MKHPDAIPFRELYGEILEEQMNRMDPELAEADFVGFLREAKRRKKLSMKYLDHLDPDQLQSRHLKKLTILHSNDLHGDFFAEKADSGLIGGVSMLSGYVGRVRNEEENVIYAIAGDMFRGSLIDSEFRGISTIEIMNLFAPDVVTVGNHEVDYGLTHLFFLEKCANFPIISANMYVKLNDSRLFRPYVVLESGGLIAECMRAQLGTDLVLIASGSIRGESLGPIVTLEDFLTVFPYESSVIGFDLTGRQIRKILSFLLSEDAFGETVWIERFQFSDGFFCEFDRGTGGILRLTLNGKEVRDEEVYRAAMQSYFFCSIDHFLGIGVEEITENGGTAELASSQQNVLIEYFEAHDYIKAKGEKSLLIHEPQQT